MTAHTTFYETSQLSVQHKSQLQFLHKLTGLSTWCITSSNPYRLHWTNDRTQVAEIEYLKWATNGI
jgi:hypothetical protein